MDHDSRWTPPVGRLHICGNTDFTSSSMPTTTHYWATSASQRPSTRSTTTTPGPDSKNLCTTCSQAKPKRHKPYGLLKQLPVPERPWNSISIDFIEQLPPLSGYTSILVVIDRLSKQGIFIATHDTITSSDLAWLFIIHVFSKHSVLAHVTCN